MPRTILKIHSLAGSQCRLLNIRVLWADCFALKVSLAVLVCNRCSFSNSGEDRP